MTVVLKVLEISLKPQLVIVISKLFLIYVRFNSICDFNIIFKILFIIITIKKNIFCHNNYKTTVTYSDFTIFFVTVVLQFFFKPQLEKDLCNHN